MDTLRTHWKLKTKIDSLSSIQIFKIYKDDKKIFEGNKNDLRESFSLEEYNILGEKEIYLIYGCEDYFEFHIH